MNQLFIDPGWIERQGRYLPCVTVVTGAFGFIGRHLTAALLGAGSQVIAVDLRPMPQLLMNKELPKTKLRVANIDITQHALEDTISGADAVVHLAALPGVRRSWGPNFAAYVSANVVGTQRIIEACVNANVRRVVFASSSSVYGNCATPTREDAKLGPLSPYGVTKMSGEALCYTYANLWREVLEIVILRYFTVYGPFQRPDMLISRIIASLLTAEPLIVNGDGSARRDFTYVEDAVRATLLALSRVRLERPVEVINIGSGVSVTIRELVALAKSVCGRDITMMHKPRRHDEAPWTEADITKAQKLLGYDPRTPLAVGLENQLHAARSSLG